jgi:hypothetical protein
MPVDNIQYKEICSRTPYSTLVEFTDNNEVRIATIKELMESHSLEEITEYGKLILYPLSSLNDSQKQELSQAMYNSMLMICGYFKNYKENEVWLVDMTIVTDKLYEWNIDFNDMIIRGMAIDATKTDAYERYIP